MKWYFEDPERCEALRIACEKREGKRFVHRKYTCGHFVHDVLSDVVNTSGVGPLPEFSLGHNKFHDTQPIIDFIMNNPEIRKRISVVDKEDGLMTGDIIAIKQSRGVHHLGIIEGQWIWHLPLNAEVVKYPLCDMMNKLIKVVFRIKNELPIPKAENTRVGPRGIGVFS